MKRSTVEDAIHRELEVHTVTLEPSVGQVLHFVRGLACRPNGDILVTHGTMISVVEHKTGLATRFAGSEGNKGYVDGVRLQNAKLSSPAGICLFGDQVLFCDWDVNVIRVIHGSLVSTFAGFSLSGHRDGPRAIAQFSSPVSLIFGHNYLWVSDQANNCIRRICAWSGVVSTIGTRGPGVQNGPFNSARFNKPGALTRLHNGDILVTDTESNAIRMLKIKQETVETIAGGNGAGYKNGSFDQVKFHAPAGIVVSASGTVFVADYYNHVIRTFQLEQGIVDTLVGSSTKESGGTDGLLKNALLSHPNFMTFSPQGDLYWSESHASRIRYIRNLSEPFTDPTFLHPIPPDFGHLWGFEFYFDSLNRSHRKYATDTQDSDSVGSYTLEPIPEQIYEFTHTPSGQTFQLHRVALGATCPEVLERGALEPLQKISSDIPVESLCAFFRLLHGCVRMPHGESHAQTALRVAHIAYFCQILRMARSWVQWATETLLTAMDSLTCAESLDLICKFAVHCEKHEAIISLMCAQLLPFQAQIIKIQHLLDKLAFDPPLFRSVLLQLVGAEKPNTSIAMDSTQVVCHSIKHMLRQFSTSLQFSSLTASPSSSNLSCAALGTPNFSISIQGNPSLGYIMVHDWIMRARWRYFRRMEDARLSEWQSRSMELPADCPPSALLHLVKYIYTGVFFESITSSADCDWLLANAAQFSITDLQDVPLPGFEMFVNHIRKRGSIVD